MENYLKELDKETEQNIIKFVLERYGNNQEFIRKTWGISRKGICRLFFKEYINWLEYKGGDNNGIE